MHLRACVYLPVYLLLIPLPIQTSVSAAIRKNNADDFHYGTPATSGDIVIGQPIIPRPRKEPEIGKIVAIVVCAVVVLFVISAVAFAFTRSKLPPCIGFLNR